LAGKDPPAHLVAAARAAGAEVAGYVASMEDEFARATALVVPLWAGAGARVKIIEAFAGRLPVVSTALGAEGLDAVPQVHYLPGESPEDLAASLARLLRSPELGESLARAGRSLAEANWSLPAVARLQNRLCSAVARGSGPPPGSGGSAQAFSNSPMNLT
jgi:glycosyltransferase involved in cell wall biosynthesis